MWWREEIEKFSLQISSKTFGKWVAIGKSFNLCRLKSHENSKPQPEKKTFSLTVACIIGALWANRGERGILREARNECEVRDEGRRKIIKSFIFLLPWSCAPHSFRASRKRPRSPRLDAVPGCRLIQPRRVALVGVTCLCFDTLRT